MTTKQGQNSVEPIQSPEKILMIKKWLLHKPYRDYFLFTFGINSGLRISDILPLRVMDVRNTGHLRIRKKKRKKSNKKPAIEIIFAGFSLLIFI
nr:hypothetical protein [Bacillus sp. PK3_68]